MSIIKIKQKVISPAEVDAEARVKAQRGFVFQGVRFDFDDKSMLRIAGAASLATQALIFGKKNPTDEFWTDEAQPFSWIAADNSMVVMTPVQVLAFGQAAAEWESRHVFHARYLKDLPVIPVDYKDDKYWP